MAFIMIYVTNENMEEAQKIASHLLEKEMIACANFFPIKSSFTWKGEVKTEDEVVAILKTKADNWEKVREEVKQIHPYETPAIIRIDARANRDFEEWIENLT